MELYWKITPPLMILGKRSFFVTSSVLFLSLIMGYRDAPELAPAPVPRVPAPAVEPEPGVAGAGAKEGLSLK